MTFTLETAFAPRYTLPTNAWPNKKNELCVERDQEERFRNNSYSSKTFPYGEMTCEKPKLCSVSFLNSPYFMPWSCGLISLMGHPEVWACYFVMMNSRPAVHIRRYDKNWWWKLASAFSFPQVTYATVLLDLINCCPWGNVISLKSVICHVHHYSEHFKWSCYTRKLFIFHCSKFPLYLQSRETPYFLVISKITSFQSTVWDIQTQEVKGSSVTDLCFPV